MREQPAVPKGVGEGFEEGSTGAGVLKMTKHLRGQSFP